MDLHTQYVDLSVSDGTSMRAYVARPATGPVSGGMLVFQEAFGVNSHIRDVTERFAAHGYVCISPELFHRTAPGLEAGYTDISAIMPHVRAMTDAGLAADIRAAHEWLQGQTAGTKIGAVGYCMGGRATTLAALTVPLACGISYYGGGIAPNQNGPGLTGRFAELQAPMLFFWGGQDSHIPVEQRQAVAGALRTLNKPYANVVFSYADHGFFCDARASYHAEAALEAWVLTLAFLDVHLRGHKHTPGATKH